MPRSVNLYIGNWQSLGIKVPVPQYSCDIRLVWTDDQGKDHERKGTWTFPNDLADVPLSRLREKIEEWLVEIARTKWDVDNVVMG